MKTMNIWRLPDVLIISLKRFDYGTSSTTREKLDTFVDFPFNELDMSKYCLSAELEDKDDRSLVYDLYAVDNHFGNMGFGHYTAFARDLSTHALDHEWYSFDDSSVTRIAPEKVKSTAAYILFYKRRNSTSNEGTVIDATEHSGYYVHSGAAEVKMGTHIELVEKRSGWMNGVVKILFYFLFQLVVTLVVWNILAELE